jgi:hypothetical protein
VVANGKAGRLFPADGDLVLVDEFADVLEADRRFVERDLVVTDLATPLRQPRVSTR